MYRVNERHLKIGFIFSWLLLCMIVKSDAQDFYDLAQVNSVELIFTEANWDSIMHENWLEQRGDRLIGTAVINGIQFDRVGVRYKGYSSYNESLAKKPLNIKLDFRVEDQTYQGYGTIKLSNGWRDPSFIREVLGYEIIRKYMPASKANYCTLSINGELIGLFTNVETVDRPFISRFFYENDGVFIKGDPKIGPSGHNMLGFARLQYMGPDSASYYNSYDLKSDNGWQDLIDLCDTLNHYPEHIETMLDVDRALWLMAVHNVLVSLDSPINTPRNFYLYRDMSDRFQIIPWDLNMTFGTYMKITGTSGTATLEMLQELDPYHNYTNDKYPLVSQLLQDSRYRKAYLAHMRTVVEENITNNWYFNRGHDIQQSISGYVADDSNKFYTFAEFRSNISSTVIGNNSFIVGITELMDGRIQFLQSHPDFLAEPPVITDITTYPGVTPVTVTATVTNAETVLFKYRYHPLEAFNTMSMADDGLHLDGVSGDHVYGVSIPAGARHLQYYLYAENGEAAAFDPPRAEYGYYTLSMSGDVVINEFMASNDAAVADQDGEFDDWIELYNNTDQEVSLTGWTLSDDLTDSTRWTFPDTAIQASAYLIIWADRDEEQAGLHAGFRISADGEVLLLMNRYREIMDEIAFGPQETDLSYGRYPNGSGSFVVMSPTFGSENSGPTAVIPGNGINIPDKFVLEQNYPNPFNAETCIRYGVQETCHLTLSIYNVHGQEVAKLVHNKRHEPGYFKVDWNSGDHMSGVYIYRLYGQALAGLSRFDCTKKMVIIK